jgi:hypothetical protein
MAFVLITLTASLIVNMAVLALLKIGPQKDASAGNFSGRLPC